MSIMIGRQLITRTRNNVYMSDYCSKNKRLEESPTSANKSGGKPPSGDVARLLKIDKDVFLVCWFYCLHGLYMEKLPLLVMLKMPPNKTSTGKSKNRQIHDVFLFFNRVANCSNSAISKEPEHKLSIVC